MSYKIYKETSKIEEIKDGQYVNWGKKKIIKDPISGGTYYAIYLDKDCRVFSFWMTRKQIKEIL